MRVAIQARIDPTARASFARAPLTCLCVVALLAMPARSDEVPGEPTPAPAGQPSAQPTAQAPPAAKPEVSKASAGEDIDPEGDKDHRRPEHGSLGNIGAKLSDPTSNLWAITMNFQGPQFFDGDVNTGDPVVGGGLVMEPVLPFPLHGTGENQWKLITRPVIPLLFSQPTPTGPNQFKHRGGIGDIQLPLLIAPAPRITKHFIFAAGPVFEFPTSTSDSLGSQQWSIGPAVALGYKTKSFTAVLFPNYFWGIGSRDDRQKETRNVSKLSLLYSLVVNLPDAWQIGFNPTISYNDKARSGDRWTVPVGVFAGKTIKVGRTPVNIKLGVEYSVISPDTFGKRAQIRLQVTPVIPGLVQNPIFGGAK